MDRKAIIIGSGLGGLECGFILAKHGYDVTVLEQDKHIGGCLRTFRRKATDAGRSDCNEYYFDTGFHYIGGLGEGQSLHPFFEYFGLLDLPWKQLDKDCFDEAVFVNGDVEKSYPFASGHEHFINSLAAFFPDERADLTSFSSFLENVGRNIFGAFTGKNGINDLFSKSAYGFLCDTIHDQKLRKVLSGTSLKMELRKDTLPLYVFAQMNDSFIQSAWRLKGGGSQIAERLAAGIESFGGKVLTSSHVSEIRESDGIVSGVEVAAGDEVRFLEADIVISDAHPAITMGMLENCEHVRKIYRRRVGSLENTYGMFTANIALKPESIKYQNHNIYINRSDADLWCPDEKKTESVMVHFYVPENGEYATHIDLLSPMSWESLAPYSMLPKKHRGEGYEALKLAKAHECMELAETKIPGLTSAARQIWTSTPLTYLSYTGSPFGSAYGIRKDFNNPMYTVLSPGTPLKNLYLTGQSLNLHGILGVSMTSVFTCAEALGMDELINDMHLK